MVQALGFWDATVQKSASHWEYSGRTGLNTIATYKMGPKGFL